jgi:hypothetical protein
VVEDDGNGGQQSWQTMIACKIGQWTMMSKDENGSKRYGRQQSGNDGCGGRRRRWWTMKAHVVDDGGG